MSFTACIWVCAFGCRVQLDRMETKQQQLINSQLPVCDRDQVPESCLPSIMRWRHQQCPAFTLTTAPALFIDPYLLSFCNAVYGQTCSEKMEYTWTAVIQCLRSQRWVTRRFKWKVISYKGDKLCYVASKSCCMESMQIKCCAK